jgi:hypothetical protein
LQVAPDEILRGGWAPPQGRLPIGPQVRNLPYGLKDVKIAAAGRVHTRQEMHRQRQCTDYRCVGLARV